MKLTFLGTRGECEQTSKFHKNHSAIRLETHDKTILLDFGASWQDKLKFVNPDYIWISQSSPEHALGLKGEETNIPVFMSEETNDKLSESQFPLKNRQVIKGKFKFGSIVANQISTNGLIIETDEGRVGYFPDTLDVLDKPLLKKLSIYIGDGTSLTKDIVKNASELQGGKKVGHKSIITQLKQIPAKKIIFTHLGKEVIEMKHDKLIEKLSELGKKFCPDISIEIALDNSTFGIPSRKIINPTANREEVLSNYLGSKRQFVNAIFRYVPKDTKTLFDPTCGSSHLPIEAAKHGIQIIGNDLCPLAYYYSSGIFQGQQFSDDDIRTLLSSPPTSGWLSKSELKRPEQLESKRLIDGLMVGAYKRFSGGKQKTALAAMSLLLQHYFRGFAAFISEEEPYSRDQVFGDLSKAVKDVNQLIGEVGGKGRIFNKNILNEEIPQADVIYFDPPYFPGGSKAPINYFKHYVHANSVLMQKKFEQEDPTKDQIRGIIPKLASKANLLIVSTTSPSAINWAQELTRVKKHVKRLSISKSSTGSQPQGGRANPTTAQEVKENLWIASDSEVKTFERLENASFDVKNYDLSKISKVQLKKDLGIVAAKYAIILRGGTTEFENKEKCLDFAERIMMKVLERGNITFSPKYEIVNGKAEII